VLRKLEWPGRLEVLSSNPLMLLDACINRESCKNVLEALGQLVQKRVITIIGIPSDKDYLGVAEAMHGISAKLILTKSQNAHYKFGPDQVVHLQERGIESVWTESIAEAVEKAREYIQETGNYELPICILGTTSLISDVKVLASTPKGIQDEKKYGI
jgi:dihydrofolate synthase/folylpolyglutamate synthase